jgi:hypothetical protein
MNKTMMLITGSWENRKTFKMLPATLDCPYNEAIFDLDSKVLAVISKEKKESFHMLPKLSDVGELVMIKSGKRSNGKSFAEERKVVETYYEYYIENPEEITSFVKLTALNADSFDFNQYLENAYKSPVETAEQATATV